jgi:hypothetical protein
MGKRTATQLPMLAWQADRLQVWRLLVMEYSQDRLRAEIRQLKEQIFEMELEQDRKRSAAMVAEIMLCLITFILGYAIGAMT